MAVTKYLNERTPTLRSWCTALISTNADGITGSDIVDLGGLSLCGLQLNALCTDANYSFRGSIDSSTNMTTLLTSTGGILTLGTTGAGVTSGKAMIFDPSQFTGVRFLQIFSGTSAAIIANAAGAAAVIMAACLGPNR